MQGTSVIKAAVLIFEEWKHEDKKGEICRCNERLRIRNFFNWIKKKEEEGTRSGKVWGRGAGINQGEKEVP